MKTLRKIGLLMMAVCMIAGMASCGGDDDGDGGNGGNGSNAGALVVNGQSNPFNYCYIYNSQDSLVSQEGFLMFSNHDMLPFLNGSLAFDGSYSDYATFQIYFKQQIFSFENLTLNPDEYDLWYDCGGRFVNKEEVGYPTNYAWEPQEAFLKAKNPGKLTISRSGNNVHVKIENLWIYGGDGFDDAYRGGSLPEGYNWLNGSFEFNGTMVNLAGIMDY